MMRTRSIPLLLPLLACAVALPTLAAEETTPPIMQLDEQTLRQWVAEFLMHWGA